MRLFAKSRLPFSMVKLSLLSAKVFGAKLKSPYCRVVSALVTTPLIALSVFAAIVISKCSSPFMFPSIMVFVSLTVTPSLLTLIISSSFASLISVLAMLKVVGSAKLNIECPSASIIEPLVLPSILRLPPAASSKSVITVYVLSLLKIK